MQGFEVINQISAYYFMINISSCKRSKKSKHNISKKTTPEPLPATRLPF